MSKLLAAIFEKCEIDFRRDADGWQLSAKGGLGVLALLVILIWTVNSGVLSGSLNLAMAQRAPAIEIQSRAEPPALKSSPPVAPQLPLKHEKNSGGHTSPPAKAPPACQPHGAHG
jgi:hypothetical protein